MDKYGYEIVTQEIYDTIVSPWFGSVNVNSDEEYGRSMFTDLETNTRSIVIDGKKYRMADLLPFAVKAMKEFGEQLGISM